MFYFMNIVRSFVNDAIFCEFRDRMRFEVDCAKSHHRIISGGLGSTTLGRVSLHSEQKCDVTLNWNLPSCVESPCYQSAVSRV